MGTKAVPGWKSSHWAIAPDKEVYRMVTKMEAAALEKDWFFFHWKWCRRSLWSFCPDVIFFRSGYRIDKVKVPILSLGRRLFLQRVGREATGNVMELCCCLQSKWHCERHLTGFGAVFPGQPAAGAPVPSPFISMPGPQPWCGSQGFWWWMRKAAIYSSPLSSIEDKGWTSAAYSSGGHCVVAVHQQRAFTAPVLL